MRVRGDTVKIWFFNLMPWASGGAPVPDVFPGRLYDREVGQELYEGFIEMFKRADDLGYDGLAFAEHHYSPMGMAPSPNLIAAAVATHTSHARIIPMGNCLPMHGHPVRLAEELAMIDVLSKGRLTSGFIRGGPRAYRAYGVDISQGRSMFEEAWDLIVKSWTEEEPFSWHGQHYHYDLVSIIPRPVQRPHPPIVEAAQTAESLEWCAQHRAPLMVGGMTMSQMADAFDYYREYARESCGWDPGPEFTGMSRGVYVSTTDAKARDEAEEYALTQYRSLSGRASGVQALNEARRTERSFAYRSEESRDDAPPPVEVGIEELMRQGYCCVGSPDTVIRWIKNLETQFGIGILLGSLPFGGMSPTLATKSLELFGREVLAHLR